MTTLSDQNERKKEELLAEIKVAMGKYRRYAKPMLLIHWSVLFAITIAGFFTALEGAESKGTKLATSPSLLGSDYLVICGLTAAIGAVIMQNLNPAKRAEIFEHKKDAMRAIQTSLNYRNLDLMKAAELVEIARHEPAKAIEDLLELN